MAATPPNRPPPSPPVGRHLLPMLGADASARSLSQGALGAQPVLQSSMLSEEAATLASLATALQASDTRVRELEDELAATKRDLAAKEAASAATEQQLRVDAQGAQKAAQGTSMQLQAALQRAEALSLQVDTLQESLSLCEAGRTSAVER